jgi:PAS domain S-box-containing protein
VGWLAVWVGAGILSRSGPHAGSAFSHLLYLPIVIAAMLWGRKGVPLIVLLGGLACLLCDQRQGPFDIWTVVRQMMAYLAVAYCVGILSDKVMVKKGALKASEERYRLLVEKSLTGILVYRDDHIIFASPRFGEMLGYRPQDVIGRPIWDFVHEQDKPKVRSLLSQRKIGKSDDLHYECRYIRADGSAMWADVASSTTEYEGEPAILVNAYDITDRKVAEDKRRELSALAQEQEEQLVHSTRLAELGEMAAAVAHELNQPLTGIKNFAKNAIYMMENDAGPPEDVINNVRLISEQVDRAARIINQMRQLTRRSERHLALVDINSVLRDSVEFVMPQFRLSGVEVFLALAENLPGVMGDRVRLEQVFLNLLTNARHAMEEVAERSLKVRTYLNPGKPFPVVVEITDTGVGFAQENVGKLFMPFYSTKEPGHGTGLGLSISLNIIKEHHGEIEAIGTPDKGATFRVKLPLPQYDAAGKV